MEFVPQKPWDDLHYAENWQQYLTAEQQAGWEQLKVEAAQNLSYDAFYGMRVHGYGTGQPKHDVGTYVQDAGFNVPVVRNVEHWQNALLAGTAMLRSEHPQDYDGLSGLLSSQRLRNVYHYPKTENDEPAHSATEYAYEPYHSEWLRRTYEGPLQAELSAGPYYQEFDPEKRETIEETELVLRSLQNGTLSAFDFMYERNWQHEAQRHRELAKELGFGYALPFPFIPKARASYWEYISGINIRVFRDPVRTGRYYVGGHQNHHIWTIEDNDTAPLKAYRKHRQGHDEDFEYEIPGDQIVDLYEAVRNLSYFDQTQAPVMEMQYGNDGKLYFLQYLKTGQGIHDPGAFSLPAGRDVVKVTDVRGATAPEGETIRLYLDPERLDRSMYGQGFYMDFYLSQGLQMQKASHMAKVVVLNYFLSFKDNHFESAPLYKPGVVLGLWSEGSQAAEARFTAICPEDPRRPVNAAPYIQARVTSNGREATIASDWEVHEHYL